MDGIEKPEKKVYSELVSVLSSVGAGACTFLGIFGTGKVVGMSAAGISSGLKAIGSFVGGGMKRGLISTMGVPVLICYGTYKLAEHSNNKLLCQETERICNELRQTLEQIDSALSDRETLAENTAEHLVELKDYLKQAKSVLDFLRSQQKNKTPELRLIETEVAS